MASRALQESPKVKTMRSIVRLTTSLRSRVPLAPRTAHTLVEHWQKNRCHQTASAYTAWGRRAPPCLQGRRQHHPGGANTVKISKTLISSTAVAQKGERIALREPPEIGGVTIVFPFEGQQNSVGALPGCTAAHYCFHWSTPPLGAPRKRSSAFVGKGGARERA